MKIAAMRQIFMLLMIERNTVRTSDDGVRGDSSNASPHEGTRSLFLVTKSPHLRGSQCARRTFRELFFQDCEVSASADSIRNPTLSVEVAVERSLR